MEEGWRRGEPLYFAMRQFQGRFAPYVAQRANILHYLESGRPLEAEHLVGIRLERGSLIRNSGLGAVPKEERLSAAKVAAEIQLRERDPFDTRSVNDFLRLLDLCRKHGIRVLLVKFPLTADYIKEAVKYVDIDRHDRRVADLLAGRAGVALLDARSKFPDRLELFTDSNHVNSRGSKLLAREIHRSLRKLAAGTGWPDSAEH